LNLTDFPISFERNKTKRGHVVSDKNDRANHIPSVPEEITMRYPVALIATLGMVVGTATGAAAAGATTVESSHAGQVPSGYVLVVTEEDEFIDDVDLSEYYLDEGETADFDVIYLDDVDSEYEDVADYEEADYEEVGDYEEVSDYAEYDDEYAEDGEDYYYEESDVDEFGIQIDEQKGGYGMPKPDPCQGKGYACRPKPSPCRDKCSSKPSRPDRPAKPAPANPGKPSAPASKHPVTGSALALYGVGGALLVAAGGTIIVSQKRRSLEQA